MMELAFLAEVAGMIVGMSVDPINWGLAFLIYYLIKIRWRLHFGAAVAGIFMAMILLRYASISAEPMMSNNYPFLYVARRSHGIFGFSIFTASIFYFISKRRKSSESIDRPSPQVKKGGAP